MNRRSLLITSAALSVAVRPAAAFAQAGPAVRVGDAIGDPYAQGYYANEEGFFKKAGLYVDFQSFASGVPIGTGVVTGNLDIGIMTPLAVANAVTHGVPLVIIAAGGFLWIRARRLSPAGI